MLKFLARLLIALALLLALGPVAAADTRPGDVAPCDNLDICVVVTDPGGTPSPGSTDPGGSGGGGVQLCSWNGQQWPCWDKDLGWFNISDGCYYHLSSPQPQENDPVWDGHKPSEGAIYEVNCRGAGGQLSTKPPAFRPSSPPGTPDDPVQLAHTAVDMMRLGLPELHAAPSGTAVGGSPVWLWFDAEATTPSTRKAEAPGRRFSVKATATLTSVQWDTDDGAMVDCKLSSGTPYTSAAGGSPSPDCGHVYKTGSAKKPESSYSLTATVTWHVIGVRSDTGEKTEFDVTRSSAPMALRVGEVQVLN